MAAREHYHVFYCDDEGPLRRQFLKDHSNTEFTFSECEDIESVPRALANLDPLPDLLVLDVFHSKTTPGGEEACLGDKLVAEKFQELYAKLNEVKEVSDRYKDARAIPILKEIRANPRLKKLPVLLYTRMGFSLISDEELQSAIDHGAEWMLRGRKPETERRRMHSFITKNKPRNRLQRDVVISVLSTLAGFLLSKIFQ